MTPSPNKSLPPDALRIGTRESPLAQWQACRVQALLAAEHPELKTELVLVKSGGDKSNAPLHEVVKQQGVGVFTKVLDDALLAGEVDCAVHSLKDYPTDTPEEIVLAAVPERGAVEDGLIIPKDDVAASERDGSVTALLGQLAQAGKKVGTGSMRRRGQIRNLLGEKSAGLQFAEIRGNIGTRLGKLLAGDYGALIMAKAPFERLDPESCPEMNEVMAIPFNSETELIPAPAQGALAITALATDEVTLKLISGIHDPIAAATTLAERTALRELGGGCMLPFGAWARSDIEAGKALHLVAAFCDESGSKFFRVEVSGDSDDPAALGVAAAHNLIKNGASELL